MTQKTSCGSHGLTSGERDKEIMNEGAKQRKFAAGTMATDDKVKLT
jgi:hypothetical protein